jgi:hypothetical protein
MTPHRPPPDVPVHLLDPADRAALAGSEQERWDRGLAVIAADPLDAEARRVYGLQFRALPPEAQARVLATVRQ